MADEVVQTEVTTPVTAEVPDQPSASAEGEGQVPAAPSLNLDATVVVDGETVTVQDLLESRQEAARLGEYVEHASSVLRSGVGPELNDQQERSVRYLMAAEGHTDDAIDEYIQFVRTGGEEQGVGVEDLTRDTTMDTPQATPEQLKIMELEQRLAASEARTSETNVSQMRRDMDGAISNVLDNHEGLGVLLNRMKSLNGDDGHDARVSAISDEVRQATMSLLRHKKAAGGQFDPTWFADASDKAAALVADKYRTVIGDPNLLRRAPETAPGEDTFFQRKPVEPPKYESSDGPAGAIQKARDYTEGVLQELVTQTDAGGQSRV